MNEQDAVTHMIEFIEEKEREVLLSKLTSSALSRSDAVKAILDELERITKDENKQN